MFKSGPTLNASHNWIVLLGYFRFTLTETPCPMCGSCLFGLALRNLILSTALHLLASCDSVMVLQNINTGIAFDTDDYEVNTSMCESADDGECK